MRLPTRHITRLRLARQQPRDDGFHTSVRAGEQACPPMCSAKGPHLSGRHNPSARAKRTADYPTRIMAANLIRGNFIFRAGCNAEAPAVVGQRINPRLKPEDHKFQVIAFLETVERTQCADA